MPNISTLIEWRVVIAIIAVLAAMLLPALSARTITGVAKRLSDSYARALAARKF